MSMTRINCRGIDGTVWPLEVDPDAPGVKLRELPDCCRCHLFPVGSEAWKAMHDYGYRTRES